MVKRKRKGQSLNNYAVFNDIKFQKNCPGADYDSSWNHLFAILIFSLYVYAGKVQFYLLPVKVR